MKTLIGMISVAILFLGSVALTKYQGIVKQRQAAAHEAFELHGLRSNVEMDELALENAQLDEELALRQHRHPDHAATEIAQAKLDAAREALHLRNDVDSMLSSLP
jgi:hypothetical protein